MARPLRLLTTDRSPGYLRGLAGLDARWDVLVPDHDGLGAWWARQRELPGSVRSVRPVTASERLSRGVYDAVICHSPSEAVALGTTGLPVVLVLHERRELAAAYGDGPETWTDDTRMAVTAARIVYASPESARSWDFAGVVAPPAVDPGEWPLGDLREAHAVSVTPFAVERAAFDTAYLLVTLLARVPVTILGLNPGMGIEVDTGTRQHRRSAFGRARVYANLSSPTYETAAPLPMLEAMASGLPVVTLDHADSPIVDGVNGFRCADADELGERVEQLFGDQPLAMRLGTAARRTIFEHFGAEPFRACWTTLLQEVTGRSARRVA